MKSTVKILVLNFLVLVGICTFSSCKKDPLTIDRKGAELIVTNYDGGTVEWVSIQKGFDGDAKIADAKQDRGDITQEGDILYINLFHIDRDTVPFDWTGKYTVVLKHNKKDKMYIKTNVKFTDGLGDAKWGTWLGW
ncbi:MAG: hypothetical protein LBB41_04330 [Prevotellaceae bacterium]|jgi:hypothetical protein|nr:hypothetical protein [Prevotellaceae bacterium]